MNEDTTVGTREVATKPAALPTFNLTPRSLAEALELAKLMAASDLVPKDFRDKPGNVLIAVQMGGEIGLPPLGALQGIAVINGRPSVYGDAGKAILLSHGCDIIETDVEEIRKTGIARCTIKRPGFEPKTRTFSLEDAKQAKLIGKQGPWSEYRERMMAWRAFWFAARDAAADLLKGVAGAEELEDMAVRGAVNITPRPETERPEPPRKSERETTLALVPDSAKTEAAKTEQPAAAETSAPATATAATSSAASSNGHDDPKKLLNKIFQLMPRYNRAKGEGAATVLLHENYAAEKPSALSPEQMAQFIRTMETGLGVVA